LRERANPHVPASNTVKSIQDILRQDVGVDGDAQRLGEAQGEQQQQAVLEPGWRVTFGALVDAVEDDPDGAEE